MRNSLDTLPEDPTKLREVSELLVSEVKALSLKVEQLQHQLHGHNRHRFGSKSEGLDRSTMSDWVGRATALLEPLADLIGRIVRQGAAIFADDTPVKMQAPGNKKTKTARVWTYVCDDRP